MIEDEDAESDYIPCPACGHWETRSQDCQDCDEMHEVVVCCDDLCVGAGQCMHGDGMAACPECNGTGIQRWCPKCGADYWHAQAKKRKDAAKAKAAEVTQ